MKQQIGMLAMLLILIAITAIIVEVYSAVNLMINIIHQREWQKYMFMLLITLFIDKFVSDRAKVWLNTTGK